MLRTFLLFLFFISILCFFLTFYLHLVSFQNLFLCLHRRDHRTVLVGDARGRVHSWSISDVSGRSIADHWLKDDAGEFCGQCRIKFSLTERRHHCRNCGHVFCSRFVLLSWKTFLGFGKARLGHGLAMLRLWQGAGYIMVAL